MNVHSGRRPWFSKFRNALTQCKTLDEIEDLLRWRVQRWRGDAAAPLEDNDTPNDDEDKDSDRRGEVAASDIHDGEVASLDTSFML